MDAPSGTREEHYEVEEIGIHSDMDEEEIAEVEGLMAAAEAAEGGGGGGGPEAFDGDLRMGRQPAPPSGMQMRQGGGKSVNTGPKGVKADYAAAKRDVQNTRMREAMRARRKLREKVNGKVAFQTAAPEVETAAAARARRAEERKAARGGGGGGDDSGDASDSSDLSGLSSDDEEAFQAFKMRRLQYFHDQLPRFGTYRRVTVEGIAEALRGVDECSVTLVHLYENDLPTCTALNLSFEELAPQFKHVQFLRCRATEAIPGFNLAGLPALMVYRGTEQVDTLLRFVQPLGRDFSDSDVVARLEEKRLLSLPMPTVAQLSKGFSA